MLVWKSYGQFKFDRASFSFPYVLTTNIFRFVCNVNGILSNAHSESCQKDQIQDHWLGSENSLSFLWISSLLSVYFSSFHKEYHLKPFKICDSQPPNNSCLLKYFTEKSFP